MKHFFYLLFFTFLFNCPIQAKTINIPFAPIEIAVEKAKKYAKDKKIDLKQSFISKVEYLNLHNEYEKSYWRIRWSSLSGEKGAWFELNIYANGTFNERHGK